MTYQILFLISSVFNAYIIYKAMKIFFCVRKVSTKMEFVSYILFYALTNISYFLFDVPLVNLFVYLVSLYLITCSYQGDWKRRVLATLFIYALFVIVETMIVMFIDSGDFALLGNGSFQSIAGVILMRVVCLTIILIMGYCQNIRKGIAMPRFYWVSISIIPISVIYLLLYMLHSEINAIITGIGIMLLLVIMMIIFVLYDSIISSYENLIHQKHLEDQAKYYDNQLKLMHSSSEQIKRFRHDMINHYNAVYSLINVDKLDKAKAYILDICSQISASGMHSSTGVDEIDCILNYKFTEAKQSQIVVGYKAEIPKDLVLNGVDINIIFSNLLDNAIQACLKLEEDRKLDLFLKYSKGRLMILMKNNFDGKVETKDSKIQTSKRDKANHGIGLSQIESIVTKYNGTMDIEYQGDIFAVDIIMYV